MLEVPILFFFVSPLPNKKNLEKTNYLDSPVRIWLLKTLGEKKNYQ